MKTKLTSLTHWAANTPPAILCIIFALFLSLDAWADPIAIGTGTATLNYANTSNPVSPTLQTIQRSDIFSNERSIAFSNPDGGYASRDYDYVEWATTIEPGIYEVEIKYGSFAWNVTPLFAVYQNNSKIKDIYVTTAKNSGGWKTWADFSPESFVVDLTDGIDPNTNYTIRATETYSSAWGLIIGHINLTRQEDVSLTAFGQETDGGATTLPSNGSNTINNVTVSTNMTIDFCNNRTYDYIFGADYTDYVDIAVDNSLKITGLATSVMYDGSGSGKLYIQFCSTTSYAPDHKVGEAIELSGHTDGGPFYTYPPTPTSVSIPNGTIKSARIYRVGTREYGIRLYRIAVATTEDVCASPLTATFSAIEVGVTGDAPANISECLGNYFEIPNANTLRYAGHKFTGWKLNNTGDLITAGTSYEMPAGGASFVAQWESFTVPTVTNLAVGEAVDKEVPLSWSIPGICDLSNPVVPSADFHNGTPITPYPVSEDNIVTVEGSMGGSQQFGVAFNIGDVTGITSVSFKAKDKSLSSGVNLWIAAINTESRKAYWEFDDNLHNCHPGSDKWYAYSFSPNISYWNNNWSGTRDYNTDIHIQQIGIFANAPGGSSLSGQGFYVNEVRYHVTNREDIDHVIVVRKAGSAPENATDGTVYNVGTKSHFLDNDDTKEFGQTYYYSVYAVHADGTLSAATTTSHTIVATPTCNITFNVGDGAIGDAPTSVNKPANGTVTLPSIGTVYKPFYAFTGWKKNNAGDLLAAGATYTVTADDVTAENISFTAQWTEDNTTRRIPAEHILNYSNQSTSVATTDSWDVTNDGINDVCLDMRQKTAEWKVFIKPGYYDISTICAVHIWGISYRLSIVDPVTDLQVKELFYEHTDGDKDNAIIRNLSKRFDLTDLAYGKQYIIRIEDTWTGCNLLVHDINFNPVTPEEIASETVLDANNTVTTGLTEVTDVDFPGDNDQSVKLYDKKMDWVVKIAKGYYNISLLYGAPEYSTRVSVALIDPEGVEPTRWFCPDQTDRNGHYYHTSGTAGTQYYSIGLDKRDLYDIDPEKTYIVRVHDENGTSNELRVKNLTFSPVAPLNIPDVTRLDANNVVIAPSIEDSRIDISNKKEAVWYAKITPGIYDFSLNYYAETGGTKVRFGIVDAVTGDTIFRDQQNKYDADHTTYTINSSAQDLQTALDADKVYKIFVKDNYASTGSVPQINYLEIVHHAEIHTRSGLRIGDYGTICLPYAVAAADRNGAELFELEQWADNGASLTISQLTADEDMEAGRPYIFQATANTATFSYYPEGDAAEAQTYNGLIGKYEEMEIPMNDDNYIIYNNKLYLVNSANIWVGANRAYIHKGGAPMNQAPANRRRVTLGVYGTQTATGFDPVTGNPSSVTLKYIENGHLFIIRDGKTYNAQGQVVK